jgi:hypothetical protein
MRITGPAALVLVAGLLATPAASGAPLGCGALAGAVVNGACHVSDRTPGYLLDITFPLDYPDEQAVVDYLSQTRAGFLNVAKTAETRNRPYEMDVSAESFRSARTRSVVLTLFQDTGTAHPTTWYKSFTYDIGRNRPVTFDTLFAANSEPLQAIFPIVERELESSTGLAGAVDSADGLDPSHYQNFAVTDDAVIFYFGRAELLPSYAGATSVSVPRADIPPLQL